MKLLTHLFLNECELGPGSDWEDHSPGWRIVQVSHGLIYWIAPKEVHDLNTGDVLVIGPAAEGTLRASQISSASLHFFHFEPVHLGGLMSLPERLSLEDFAQAAAIRIIPATGEIASELAALAHITRQRRSFTHRCRLLHLVAMIFADAMPDGTPERTHVSTARLRFDEVISRIPDAELIHCSSGKLAEMCGCSLPYFRRMFRRRFKTSLRDRQTELRLEKARQLLVSGDEKLVTIAHESGYRDLGSFHAMFKKKLGTTPEDWRQQRKLQLERS